MASRRSATAPPKSAATGTRRSARLAALKAAAAPDTTEPRVEKTKAPPKAKPQKYECTTCGRTLAGSSFPNNLPTGNCATHHATINTCKQCTQHWIAAQLDGVTYDRLKCSECPELLQHDDVKRLASTEVWLRWEEMERRGIADKVPGWRWCMNYKCREGQVHEPLLKKQKEDGVVVPKTEEAVETSEVLRGMQEAGKKRSKMPGSYKMIDRTSDVELVRPTKRVTRSARHNSTTAKPAAIPAKKKFIKVNEDDICTCHACGAKACVPCDSPYHDGETCAQFQKRRQREGEEVMKSEQFIESKCKQCPRPTCKKHIEKNGGCDAVRCTQCGEHFCWLCMTTYAVINDTGHARGCIYAQQGRFDPHAAANAPNGANVLFRLQAMAAAARIPPAAPVEPPLAVARIPPAAPVEPPAAAGGVGWMAPLAGIFGAGR